MPTAPEAFAVLRAHAKVLREGQASHQQPLAAAIEVALEAADAKSITQYAETNAQLTSALADAKAQLEIARGHLVDMSAETERLIAKTGDRDNLEVKVVELEGKLKAAEARVVELEAALAGKVGTGTASTAGETMADIKAKSKGKTST